MAYTDEDLLKITEAVRSSLVNSGKNTATVTEATDIGDVADIVTHNAQGKLTRISPNNFNKENISRLQGTSENSNAMKDPFKFVGSFNTSTIGNLRTWLDNLHGTSSGLDNRGFYRAILNDSVIEITSSPINYATEEYIQVVRGRVSVASTTGLLTFSYEYNILERKYSAAEGWSSWRVVASADKFEDLYAKAIQIGSFEVESLTDGIGVNFSNIDGTQSDSFEIPAATTESAGVMSAEDKKEQVKKTPLVNGDIIVGQAREVYSRQGKIDSATFLKRTTAGGTSVSDGVASVKQIGGNIVKNLVDGTFNSGWSNRVAVTHSLDKGIACITTTGNYTGIEHKLTHVEGHIYYVSSLVKSSTQQGGAFVRWLSNGDGYAKYGQDWQRTSLRTRGSASKGAIVISSTLSGTFYATQPLCIDLTEMFGAGNEPDQATCDRLFGTMDALPQGLTIAQPTGLKSTGYNQWNPANIIKDKTITDNAITDLAGSNIAVVECLPCKVGAGENNGYVIGYGEGDSWSDDGIEVYLTPLNPMEIEGELFMHKLEKDTDYGTYVPQIKGYLLVVAPTTDELCAHLHWSGDRAKTDYEEYIESNIAIPSIPSMSEWGLAGISTSGTLAADTIDLDRMVYTKKIGRIDMGTMSWKAAETTNYNAYSAKVQDYLISRTFVSILCEGYQTAPIGDAVGDINYVVSSAYSYIKIVDGRYTSVDSFKAAMQGVYLYYELAIPEEYPIVTKTAPNYIGSDYGVEEFTGSKVPLAANILFYMRSLVGETRNFLDQLYTNTQKSDAKEVANYITNGIEDNKQLAINAPNLALRALYIAAGAVYDSNTRLYSLNGVNDLSEQDIKISYNYKEVVYHLGTARILQNVAIRAFYPRRGSNMGQLFVGNTSVNGLYSFASTNIEIFKLGTSANLETTTADNIPQCTSFYGMFYGCTKLHTVYPLNLLNVTSVGSDTFKNCIALKVLRLYKLHNDLRLSDSPLIDKESILYIINNSAPTSVITITLHASAYAYLAEDADIVEALGAQPLVTLVSA